MNRCKPFLQQQPGFHIGLGNMVAFLALLFVCLGGFPALAANHKKTKLKDAPVSAASGTDSKGDQADPKKDVALIFGPKILDNGDALRQINTQDASIATAFQAKAIVEKLFSDAKIPADGKDFACIIHVIRWSQPAPAAKGQPLSKLEVANSNWYVYTPRDANNDKGFTGRRRIYGSQSVYVLIIHLDAPIVGSDPTYQIKYEYRTTHRKPANIQHLLSAIDIYNSLRGEKGSKGLTAGTSPIWAIGQISGDPPADIALTPEVLAVPNPTGRLLVAGETGASPAQPMILDTKETIFDNEGLYHWDVSIGVPIVSYQQLQNVVSSGTSVPAEVDKRNMLALLNLYLPPVDLQDPKVLGIPHFVGGISFASKPLHGAFVGVGWGPTLANFYVGTMIVTSNVSPGKTATHYKLGFGLNFPVRAIADKLGIKTQIE